MKFKLVADIEFEAEDVDHAIEILAAHFLFLYKDEPLPRELEFAGSIEVKPKDEYMDIVCDCGQTHRAKVIKKYEDGGNLCEWKCPITGELFIENDD